jgi:hypothetical protein
MSHSGPPGINCLLRHVGEVIRDVGAPVAEMRGGLVGQNMMLWCMKGAGNDTSGGKESLVVGNGNDFEHIQP